MRSQAIQGYGCTQYNFHKLILKQTNAQHIIIIQMYQGEGERSPNQAQQHLRVYSHDKTVTWPMDSNLSSMTIEQIVVNVIRPQMGYSSRIFLYKQPLCSFNKIDACTRTTRLAQVVQQFGEVCFTYNNTQYSEEPDYNHMPNYTRKPSADTIEIVVQIAQNDFFVHENYRVPLTTRINFFTNVCNRYGNNIHVQYYNTRLHLAEFAADSIVQHTVAKFLDHMTRLTITVDSVREDHVGNILSLRPISKEFLIDTKFYYKLNILNNNGEDNYFVISRKCNVNSLRYLLQIHYKHTNSEQVKQGFITEQQVMIGKLKKQTKKLITLSNPIQNCQIVGTIGDIAQNTMQVMIIKQSCILYRIHVDIVNMRCFNTNTTHLPCIGTQHLDQDLFFIKDQQLLSYAITINMIKLKYYTTDGDLLMLKVFPWYHQLYQIEFNVVDLFCVRLKNDKKKVRVFFIYDPQNYIEIGPLVQKFYPAKLGNNVYTDHSGIFAITNQWAQSVEVYSVTKNKKLTEIRLQNYKQLFEVLFTEQILQKQNDTKVVLNFDNKLLSIYSIMKTELLLNILCEKGMSNFFCIGEQVACSMGSQLRIFQNKIGQQNKECIGWKQPKHIVQKSAIIIVERNKLLIREVDLQFNQFSKFYIY